MQFKVISDTFSIARDSDHYVQLKTIKKPGSEDQVFLSIEIVGDSKYAKALTQKIVDTLEDVYFENPETDAYERFENALKEVNLVVNSMKDKKGAESLGDVSAIIAVLSGNDLHLTQSGLAEAYLLRKGKFNMISEGLSSKSKDLFTNIASGELLPDDKFVLSTTRLLRIATNSQLAKIFTEGVTEAMDSVKELTMTDDELHLGALCVHVKEPATAAERFKTKGPNPVWAKLKGLFVGISKKTSETVAAKTPKLQTRFNKNYVLGAIVVIAVLLVVSVNVLMEGAHDRALREEYRLRIEALNQDLNTASTKGYANDKETANAILQKVEGEAREILETNYFRPEVLALLEKAEDTRDNINNTERFEGLAPIVDLTVKTPDVEAQGFAHLDGNFFVYELQRLHEVILDQVLDPKTIDETEIIADAGVMEDQDLILFLTQSGRVIEYDKNDFRFVSTDDQVWKNGQDLVGYGRNIYILNGDENQIYKYPRVRDKFAASSAYNQDASIEGGISVAIDGDVYVLKKGGELVRMFKSEQVPFEINDLATDLSNATQILTFIEQDHLYVLDPVDNKVVVIEKLNSGNGLYRAQYIFEDLPTIVDFYVNKSEDKLYLLTSQEIYQVDI